jgi:hypothetical protein
MPRVLTSGRWLAREPRKTAEQVKAEGLGIGVPRARYRPGGLHPDTSALLEGWGLK